MNSDVCAAISTALSNSGLSVIRISGDNCFEKINDIVYSKGGKKFINKMESHTVKYGLVVDIYNKEYEADEWEKFVIDEVMVTYFKGPKSFTAEDTVEISCHGGVFVTKKILDLITKCGVRIAEPGEFTKRAFLNGRIDLSKAEAVMDVINSKNNFALSSSINQLNGKLYKEIKNLREKIIYEIAFIESALDDPEHIDINGYPEKLDKILDNLIDRIKKLIDTSENGKIIKEGISTVIVGKPNAGKSSLLNLLLGEERAIVTDIAGTTRDVLTETINIEGITLNVVDTAGIRETEDYVEKIGVDKSRQYAESADLIIYIVDSSVSLDENDFEIIKLISNKNCIILLNKTDLDIKVDEKIIDEKILEIIGDNKKFNIIKTSIKENMGIDNFENILKNMFFNGNIKNNDEIIITNLRHKNALENCYNSLLMVKKSIEDDLPEDFYSIDLLSSYTSLGLIIGEEVEDDLVEEIFSKFCMGK